MRKIYFTLLLFLFVGISKSQLVLNEVSQGAAGAQEYAEFVVVGNPTCTDSCVDLRGWIFDDNNGWHATGAGVGIAQGAMRFKNIPQWQCVKYGTIILIYNDQDKNTSITLPDDVTDANHDHVFIIPASNDVVLDKDVTNPTTTNPSYVPFTPNGSGTWIILGMRNAGDAFHTVSPTNLTSAYHSVCWGDNNLAADIYFSGSSSGIVYSMKNSTSNNSFTQTNWDAQICSAINETPGLPNNAANSTWITQLKNASHAAISGRDTIYPKRCAGGTYTSPLNHIYTTAGTYSDTINNTHGCDSIVVSVLSFYAVTNHPITVSGCDSVIYKTIKYFSNTTVKDTLKSSLGCDSIINIASIQVLNSANALDKYVCILNGQNYLAGGSLQTTSGLYQDTYISALGCDSIVKTHLQVISPTTLPATNLSDCKQVIYKGVTYTASTVLKDTVFSALGCDSVYHQTNISISGQVFNTSKSVCINNGFSYFAGGGNQTTSGTYHDLYTSVGGCDSNVSTILTVVPTMAIFSRLDSCNPVTWKGKYYTRDTVVSDTILTAQGCISQINFDSIFITPLHVVASATETAIMQGDSTLLSISPNTFSSIVWNPASGNITAPNSASTFVHPKTTTTFQVNVADNKGCLANDTIQIKVTVKPIDSAKVITPTAFSPNGDGKNEFFKPLVLGNGEVHEFRIYNRWGELVHSETNLTDGWDGTYKSALQPMEVYVYYYTFYDGDRKKTTIYSGNLTLIR